MRNKLSLILGIVIAVIAAYLVNFYITQQRRRDLEEVQKKLPKIEDTRQVPVLTAKQDIPKGGVMSQDVLDVKLVPEQFVQPQAVTSLDRVSGMITVALIAKGEQVTLSKLMSSKEAAGAGSLSMATPIGKRATTISVDNISAVGGMIRPGDYVDVVVIANIPVAVPGGKQAAQSAIVPLFQNALVLAVGQETAIVSPPGEGGRYKKSEERKEPSPLITLALSPQEANLLAFVQEQGKIRLSLRSPSDAKIEPIQPVSWDSLFHYIAPAQTELPAEQMPQQTEAVPAPGESVEIYRGLNKERIPFSQ